MDAAVQKTGLLVNFQTTVCLSVSASPFLSELTSSILRMEPHSSLRRVALWRDRSGRSQLYFLSVCLGMSHFSLESMYHIVSGTIYQGEDVIMAGGI